MIDSGKYIGAFGTFVLLSRTWHSECSRLKYLLSPPPIFFFILLAVSVICWVFCLKKHSCSVLQCELDQWDWYRPQGCVCMYCRRREALLNHSSGCTGETCNFRSLCSLQPVSGMFLSPLCGGHKKAAVLTMTLWGLSSCVNTTWPEWGLRCSCWFQEDLSLDI